MKKCNKICIRNGKNSELRQLKRDSLMEAMFLGNGTRLVQITEKYGEF